MESKAKSFILYTSRSKEVDLLTDEQAGKLLKAIFKYANNEEVPEFEDDIALKIVYSIISGEIGRNQEKYNQKCERIKEAALRREEEKRKSTENSEKHNRAEKAQSCTIVNEKHNRAEKAQIESNNVDVDDDVDKDVDVDKDNDVDVDDNKDVDVDDDISFLHHSSEKMKEGDCEKVLALYNSVCEHLTPAKVLTEKRKARITELLKSYSVSDFETAFKNAEKNEFMRGENNSKWIANLDWILKSDNFLKCLEGYEKQYGKDDFDPRRYEELINNF